MYRLIVQSNGTENQFTEGGRLTVVLVKSAIAWLLHALLDTLPAEPLEENVINLRLLYGEDELMEASVEVDFEEPRQWLVKNADLDVIVLFEKIITQATMLVMKAANHNEEIISLEEILTDFGGLTVMEQTDVRDRLTILASARNPEGFYMFAESDEVYEILQRIAIALGEEEAPTLEALLGIMTDRLREQHE